MNYALITGASSGIGLACARRLAAAGRNLILASDRDADNRRAAAELAERYGIRAEPCCIDLARAEAAQQLYDWTAERGMTVDVLISNAGMLLFSTLEHTPSERIDRIVALHCTTPTQLCRLFGAEMRRRGEGYILLVSSVTAWTPYPAISHYAATKAYLRSLGQSLWYEFHGSGVGVTTLFPSAVDTPLYRLEERMRRRLLRWGLMLTADEVARRALGALFRRRRRCLPGAAAKLEAALCTLLPACALLPVLRIPAVERLLAKL